MRATLLQRIDDLQLPPPLTPPPKPTPIQLYQPSHPTPPITSHPTINPTSLPLTALLRTGTSRSCLSALPPPSRVLTPLLLDPQPQTSLPQYQYRRDQLRALPLPLDCRTLLHRAHPTARGKEKALAGTLDLRARTLKTTTTDSHILGGNGERATQMELAVAVRVSTRAQPEELREERMAEE